VVTSSSGTAAGVTRRISPSGQKSTRNGSWCAAPVTENLSFPARRALATSKAGGLSSQGCPSAGAGVVDSYLRLAFSLIFTDFAGAAQISGFKVRVCILSE